MAVPFFMLAGELMNAGGMSNRIIAMAQALVGHIRGGLGYVAIIGALVLASISGSAVADSAALAAVLIPLMRKGGYNIPRAAGLISAGGIIAPVIPPSIGFIVFGVAAQVSITKLFLAGVFPGLMMALTLWVTWWICARREAPPVEDKRFDAAELRRAIADGVWALGMPVIIIGGMRFGVFTPTEAAVVAVVYALLVGMFVYRQIKWSQLPELVLSAAKVSSVVMFLVACAMVSAWLITIADVPSQISAILEPFMENKILLTPPVGVVLNVVAGVARVDLGAVVKGVWPFLVAQVGLLLLFILFPSLITVPASWLY